jgi:hypothetical protein
MIKFVRGKLQPPSHNEMEVGVFFFFFEFSSCNIHINSSVTCKLIIFFNFICWLKGANEGANETLQTPNLIAQKDSNWDKVGLK